MTEPWRVVFNSGGIGSYVTAKRVTAKRVAAKWGREKLVNLFTDTREESRGLYRFLIESVATLHGVSDRVGAVLDLVAMIPTERGQARVDAIAAVQARAAIDLPQLTWISGRLREHLRDDYRRHADWMVSSGYNTPEVAARVKAASEHLLTVPIDEPADTPRAAFYHNRE